MPLAFVVDCAAANDPPKPIFCQATTRPASDTGPPDTFASCALIVTAVPAIGAAVLEVTTYCVGVLGTKLNAALARGTPFNVAPRVAGPGVFGAVSVATYVPSWLSVVAESVSDVAVITTVPPDALKELPLASRSWTVIVVLDTPSAASTGTPGVMLERAMDAGPAIDVSVELSPTRPLVSRTAIEVLPIVVAVVNCTTALPVASAVDVGEAKVPAAPVKLQVTRWPAVATAFPNESTSCAVTVTAVPAMGAVPLSDTKYATGVPGRAVALNTSGEPARPADVAVSVFGPDAVPITQLPTVATPLAFVVCMPPVTLPPPVATANVTATTPTGLLNGSFAITLGAVATCAATVAVWLFPATIAS